MPRYLIANRVVDSDLALPELRAATGPATLSFRLGRCRSERGELLRRYQVDGAVVLQIDDVEHGWRFRFPRLATFRTDLSGDILAEPFAGVPQFTVNHLLIDQVVPLHLVLSGNHTVLHASGIRVAVGGEPRAVLFLGPSGAGKSTTAAGCVAAGAALLADDFALLDFGRPVPALVPAGVGVRLWGDVLDRVDPSVPRISVLSDVEKKRVLLQDATPVDRSPVQIAAIVWLGARSGADAQIDIARSAPAFSTIRILEQSFRPRAGMWDADRQSLDRAARLAEAIPVVEAALPASLDDLPSLCGRLLARLEALIWPIARDA
jgi:hypothetical protein